MDLDVRGIVRDLYSRKGETNEGRVDDVPRTYSLCGMNSEIHIIYNQLTYLFTSSFDSELSNLLNVF